VQRAFRKAQKLDPDCAMCFWGEGSSSIATSAWTICASTKRRHCGRRHDRAPPDPAQSGAVLAVVKTAARAFAGGPSLCSEPALTAAARATLANRRSGRRNGAPIEQRNRTWRWAAAVAAIITMQDEYRALLDNLPPNLEGSRLAEKLQAIAELDLEELQATDPPRGYGRD